ncbi:hypothetical protein [Corallococcus sicarius]|uniref:Lipoprotein n=1 Tax=Corallococcus sicarius TaxID=2316726 RepID=A0A3A8MYG8_9BACT|nr:hypothetical protein [Corallococcus sicarius]RKH37317.1 hypothetical protein D7X12_29965 [Corallococcus sicarius]
MKFRKMAALFAACGALAACGGGSGSLPTGNDPGNPTTNPDGSVDLPGNPVDPGGVKPDPKAEYTSLWPLTQGSTWTYRITDPVNGVFNKTVTVLGQETVPDTQMTAVKVHSKQDRTATTGTVYEENSWQMELTNGLVVRLREEDITDGLRTRATTWSPAMMKSLATSPASVPWEHRDAVRELITYDAGGTEGKDPTYVWKVLAKDVTVTTPAGTFTNAIKVQRDKLNKSGEVKEEKQRLYWLVPGVGKVREEGERTEELSSFDVKKP